MGKWKVKKPTRKRNPHISLLHFVNLPIFQKAFLNFPYLLPLCLLWMHLHIFSLILTFTFVVGFLLVEQCNHHHHRLTQKLLNKVWHFYHHKMSLSPPYRKQKPLEKLSAQSSKRWWYGSVVGGGCFEKLVYWIGTKNSVLFACTTHKNGNRWYYDTFKKTEVFLVVVALETVVTMKTTTTITSFLFSSFPYAWREETFCESNQEEFIGHHISKTGE